MAEDVQSLNMEVIEMGNKVEEINNKLEALVQNAKGMEEVNEACLQVFAAMGARGHQMLFISCCNSPSKALVR